jgi:DNA-directed RNA polymerase subunit beta'
VEYRDLIEGVTMKLEVNTQSGQEEIVVQEHSDDLHPTLLVMPLDSKGDASERNALDSYSLPAEAHIVVPEHKHVKVGEILAKTPRQTSRTKDITGGLPRVAELFEARRPKEAAEIAKIDGIVKIDKPSKGKRNISIIDPENGSVVDHPIPPGKRIVVFDNDYVHKGATLTDGAAVLHEMLDVCGPMELQEYLVNEVQQVYRLQGVEINDKHIEIIVRQMMRRVRVVNPGQTRFLFNEVVDKREFNLENQRVLEEGGEPAEAQQVLLGITKASLATDSFISAASFQDTTRVLTEAVTLGRVDYLRGFKENVIMGHLIPAGTGYHKVRNVKLEMAEEGQEKEANADLHAMLDL